MKKFALSHIKNVHFTGIGGISMSGLSEILHNLGMTITGSDVKESEMITHLEEIGIKVSIGHNYENVPDNCELLVYTSAVKADNPELLAAREKDIEIMERATLLGLIMQIYDYSVAVAGAHGKTTTTCMISDMLLSLGKDPSVSVGGILNSTNSNFRLGKSEYFVTEACEYCDNFLRFFPHVGIILNIEHDHADYFENILQMENSFNKFAKNIPPNGALIINKNIKNYDKIIEGLYCTVFSYGLNCGDFYADNIKYDEFSHPSFDIYQNGQFLLHADLNVCGEHNIENALCACATGVYLGLSPEEIEKGLKAFTGSKRRFEFKGEFNGVRVYDDYAHHPTEIMATLETLKKMNYNKLHCVFQPHTYSRTKALMDEFASSFELADTVVILDIFSARETESNGVSSVELYDKIKTKGKNVHYFKTFKEAEDFFKEISVKNDMLITLGAGDVYLIADNLVLS
ncbi:MAG: UDP-N-acetylmuramate--L-alanine ligase [Defluviitaleaceae bacterium]|nr:UDP-N-acetylmuramate--L-alanine ligase [Defluviitaleaceae bacterium]